MQDGGHQMKGRSKALAVLVWMVTVVAVAAVTWRVIDAAGQDAIGGVPATEPPVTTTHPTATASTPPTSPRPSPSASRTTPSQSPSPQAGATTGSTSRPTTSAPTTPAAPTSGPNGAPSGSSSAEADPTPTTAATSHPTPVGQTDTWRGAAGTVTVTCSGSGVDLGGATPADGYRVEVEQDGEAVEVMFKRDEPEDEVKVRATCPGGVPDFEVEDRRWER